VAPAPSPMDRFYAELPARYRAVARALRAAIRAEAPDLRETIKWNNPFWVGRADVLCLQCFPDHVNLGFLRGAELADRFPSVEGSGRRMRHLKVPDRATARSPRVRRMVRAAAALDRRTARGSRPEPGAATDPP
jgi:hypothetical protein